MSEELTSEDRALLAALAALAALDPEPGAAAPAPGSQPAAGPAPAAEEETLGRLYHEALGLMAYALPPAPPPPEAKRRLMALAAPAPGSAATATPEAPPESWPRSPLAADAPPSSPPALSSPAQQPSSLSLLAHAASPARPASFTSTTSPARRSSPSRSSRWPLSLAAALILALLGVCGWLYRGLAEKGDAIARLAVERNSALQHAGEVEARLQQLDTQVNSLRAGVAMVTSPAVEVCTLRAVAQAGAPDVNLPEARGMLFVAADHQHWYLSVRGLRPAGEGRVYQLWFVADQGMVSGGTFAANREASSELSSEHMPAGTKGVRITLEHSPGAPAPNGPDVLRNADALHSI